MNSKLTKEQKEVLFEKATEPAFSGKLLHNKEQGNYVCANCGNELFDSKTKFDSNCGWPSFSDAIKDSIEFVSDDSHGMKRIEVVCAKCKGHLGHIFDDGPKPTGKRYCINSLSMGFKKQA